MGKAGLGWSHQQLRRRLPRPNGQLCPFFGDVPGCPGPMFADDDLDLDHVRPRSEGGASGPVRWAHASCNRSAGASLGNAQRARFGVRSRRW